MMFVLCRMIDAFFSSFPHKSFYIIQEFCVYYSHIQMSSALIQTLKKPTDMKYQTKDADLPISHGVRKKIFFWTAGKYPYSQCVPPQMTTLIFLKPSWSYCGDPSLSCWTKPQY